MKKFFLPLVCLTLGACATTSNQSTTANREPASIISDEIDFADGSLYMQMIPHAFMDTTGFNSTPEAFTVPGMSADEPLFPLFPMFEKRLMGQKFIGAYIPNTYLGTYKPAPGTIMFGSAPHTPQVIAAESQILKMHMTPFMLNGDLLALDPSIDSVRVLNSSTFGFSFDLASLGHNSLNLGKSEGTNLGEPFNQTFKSIQRILEGPQAEKAFQNTLKLLPYYQAYLAYNGSRADNNSPNNLEAVPAKAMKPPQPQQVSLPAPMSLEQFSSELQNLHRELLSHLQKEIDWQKKVMDTVGMTMILKDLEASQFIQELCDQVAATLQVPPNLSPRCRIQATLAPNAFAFPGGDIFVTVGLIGILSDLDSLMFVLGHEVGHVVARHSTKSWGVVAPLEGVFNVAALASNLWSLSGGLGMWGVNLTSWFPKSLAAGQIAGHTLSWSMQGVGIGLAAYSRDHERQADRIGQQAALSLGMDNKALVRGWSEFSTYVEKYFSIPASWTQRLYASHPGDQERLASLDSRFAGYKNLYQPSNYPGNAAQARYQELHKKFQPYVEEYGQKMKENRESKDPRRAQYASMSLFSASQTCVHSALGGIREGY